jgi:ABC-type tungstate transport system permease subunit
VICVARARHPAGAAAFADWIISSAAQQLIGRFGIEQVGQPLFVPDAGRGVSIGPTDSTGRSTIHRQIRASTA